MEFVYGKPAGGVSRPVSLAEVMEVERSRLDSGEGPFKGLLDGHDMFEGDRMKALRRTKAVASNMKVGETLRVRRVNQADVAFWLRTVAEDAKVIDINGNEHADEFWTWVVTEFPEYSPRFAGGYVCKDVAGTSTASQHSFGNACDVFFDSFAHQTIVFKAVEAGRCPVPIANAISGTRIWSPPSNERAYSGEPHWHLHCDFLPQYSGSCGIRG